VYVFSEYLIGVQKKKNDVLLVGYKLTNKGIFNLTVIL